MEFSTHKNEKCNILLPAIKILATKEFSKLKPVILSHSFNVRAFGIMFIYARLKLLGGVVKMMGVILS